MTNNEKIAVIRYVMTTRPEHDRFYGQVLKMVGGADCNYYNHLSSNPFDIDQEIKEIYCTDMLKCRALITVIIRRDGYGYDSLGNTVRNGNMNKILKRMIELLKNEENDNESID